jgi:2-dehydropantoate 2-reductase
MKASMANDLEAGNRLELDWLAGKVVALGRKYGISTPAQEAVYAILKPYRIGRVQYARSSARQSTGERRGGRN